jgi:hypothetical protein
LYYKELPFKLRAMKNKEFVNVEVIVGYFDGIPMTDIITAQEQKEAAKYGIYLNDLVKMYQYEDPYKDC